MHRFFVANLPAQPAGVVQLDRNESHHAVRVLRLSEGSAVELLDGVGGMASGVVVRGGKDVAIRVDSVTRVPPPTTLIDVAAAIPKGSRADAMIEQLSQLGVHRLMPLLSRHSVVDPREAKLEKFQRAAMESAKQCGRAWLMKVEEPVQMGPGLWSQPSDLRLIADPKGAGRDVIDARLAAAKRVLIVVGPEGGFADAELQSAAAAGCVPWSLGNNILRIETAAVVAAAIAGYVAATGQRAP